MQEPNNTQSYNRYSYVANNPMSAIDPTGYAGEDVIGNGFCDDACWGRRSDMANQSAWDFMRSEYDRAGTVGGWLEQHLNDPIKFPDQTQEKGTLDGEGPAAEPILIPDETSCGICIKARNANPQRSNHNNITLTRSQQKAMRDGRNIVAVPRGSKDARAGNEVLGFVVRNNDSSLSVIKKEGAKTSSDNQHNRAKGGRLEGSEQVIHGHIDGTTDGFISDFDSQPLTLATPMANGVVREGRLGVTELDDGVLQFRLIDGSISTHEIKNLQTFIDNQQATYFNN